jgi:hypothetical protein
MCEKEISQPLSHAVLMQRIPWLDRRLWNRCGIACVDMAAEYLAVSKHAQSPATVAPKKRPVQVCHH